MKQPISTICSLIFLLCSFIGQSQTTDISASTEATDLEGNPISNIIIYQDFYYVTTISNSGNSVANATFTQQVSPNATVLFVESLNAVGGASDATNFSYNEDSETITATIPNLPNGSSVAIRVLIKAPKLSGGISTSATVSPPDGTTDTSPGGNTSIISMDVTYTSLDFSVSYQQINPTSGTAIAAWGDQVTFEITITNNSDIQYPIDDFGLFQGLASNSVNGSATLQLVSLDCISATNGVTCPASFPNVPGTPIGIVPIQEVYQYAEEIVFPPQASLTFNAVFQYTEGDCGIDSELIRIQSFAEITLTEPNTNSNQSNIEITDLLDSTECPCTDVIIATEQINPAIGTIPDWGDEVTYQTILTNNGPLDTTIQFFFQNLGIYWEFASINCVSATGGVNCSDINFNIENLFWEVDNFLIPDGATIVIETTVVYSEPFCPTDALIDSPYRTTVNMLEHIDCNIENNNDFDSVILPQATGTDDCVTTENLVLTKTQVVPELPLGSTEDNPIPWGDVTYHITVTNNNANEVPLTLVDYYNGTSIATGTLQSVTCIETTGTADCIPIVNANIDVPLTTVDEVFWEVTEDENWVLPTQSSVTFEVVVNWNPECSSFVVPVENGVSAEIIGLDGSSVTVTEESYLTSCVDLIIQTYPSQATAPLNADFNWVVDITNSIQSSTATDAIFSTEIHPAFTISGTPTCMVTAGNASCITSFSIDTDTNEVSGIIPFLDPDATIQIIIPVTAPNYGGSFTNTAEVQPDPANNTEFDASTNVSISSVQILSPTLSKTFTPNEINAFETSVLAFTIENVAGNLAQTEISFTDNLPDGIFLAGTPYWVESNGATADFSGAATDDFVGVSNLTIPAGVASCTFAVEVTSEIGGFYTNDFLNFSNLLNIDASLVSATLNVLPPPPSTDLQITKVVDNQNPSIGETVTFSIEVTNNGDENATTIFIQEQLPGGYTYVSHTASNGTYDTTLQQWTIPNLDVGNTATLLLTVTVTDIDDYVNVVEITNQTPVDTDLSNNIASAETFPDCLEIPRGFSPNNDLLNDVWEIRCLENYGANELVIFNRWGTIVYKMRNYTNNWNGEANQNITIVNKNGRLPAGTYFYILKLQDNTIEKTGWLYLNY